MNSKLDLIYKEMGDFRNYIYLTLLDTELFELDDLVNISLIKEDLKDFINAVAQNITGNLSFGTDRFTECFNQLHSILAELSSTDSVDTELLNSLLVSMIECVDGMTIELGYKGADNIDEIISIGRDIHYKISTLIPSGDALTVVAYNYNFGTPFDVPDLTHKYETVRFISDNRAEMSSYLDRLVESMDMLNTCFPADFSMYANYLPVIKNKVEIFKSGVITWGELNDLISILNKIDFNSILNKIHTLPPQFYTLMESYKLFTNSIKELVDSSELFAIKFNLDNTKV